MEVAASCCGTAFFPQEQEFEGKMNESTLMKIQNEMVLEAQWGLNTNVCHTFLGFYL